MRHSIRKVLKLKTWMFTVILFFLGLVLFIFNEPLTYREAFIFSLLCTTPCILLTLVHIIKLTGLLLQLIISWIIAVITLPLNMAKLASNKQS